MKTIFAAALIAFACCFSVACTNAPPVQNIAASDANRAVAFDSAQLRATQQLYTERCARCHKENGAGGNIQIEAFSLKVPNLKDSGLTAKTDDDYRRKIENGGDGMPKFKDKLAPSDIANLVRYIRLEIQGK